MKIAIFIILLSSLCLRMGAASEEPLEYGHRQTGMITVRAQGQVQAPGGYHVAADIKLSGLLGKARLTDLANGKLFLHRTIQERKEMLRIHIDKKASRERKELILSDDVQLRDGDLVYAAINMP